MCLWRRYFELLLLVATSASCSESADPLPQLVVVVDTNAPVAGQVASVPSWQGVAVDTVRVDVLTPSDSPSREFVLPEPTDWPLSFGVAPAEGEPMLLRIRAFSSRWASPGVFEGIEVSDPYRPLTIDRLVELRRPEEDVSRVRVLLDADCLGALVELGSAPSSCIDANRLHAAATEGIEPLADESPASDIGTWPALQITECVGAPVEDRICIPGGLSTLGDLALVGFGAGPELMDPVPMRPVELAPFWMDRLEFTVGRFRALVLAGQVTAPLPDTAADSYAECVWRGADDASNDGYPLNCVERETAVEACGLVGGRLPSEAEWEHAARGRGDGRRYPWGNTTPDCCITGVQGVDCQGRGMEEAGSHPPERCGGVGDLSRDGVADLGGSLSEMFLDTLRPYDAACWSGPGALRNPLCEDPSTKLRGLRGGNWRSGQLIAAAALRHKDDNDAPITTGFRCAYEDGS
ncbi:MAG: SUMF1/EgtB/PvdO family nonheme iron enzyme [Deltaproteobacteria bacterium]|jgi:formylglycine-generating enzyme required for sulfatase activity|nr:SUMF1/EgtB/PvdO family nonheme iron enzyme [Deltaproteobacteria bacterium]MBW2530658.1 SUMF1/EgtB/PvdO family nonheme iron enzyme [Deltaproteobacteria bacterium]